MGTIHTLHFMVGRIDLNLFTYSSVLIHHNFDVYVFFCINIQIKFFWKACFWLLVFCLWYKITSSQNKQNRLYGAFRVFSCINCLYSFLLSAGDFDRRRGWSPKDFTTVQCKGVTVNASIDSRDKIQTITHGHKYILRIIQHSTMNKITCSLISKE